MKTVLLTKINIAHQYNWSPMSEFLIYGKRMCGFTEEAVRLAAKYKLPHRVEYHTHDSLRGLERKYNHHTFPLVILRTPTGDRYIGGATELAAFLAKNYPTSYQPYQPRYIPSRR